MRKVLIVTGGSGGHVVPSITLFEHLKNNFLAKIVTDSRGKKFIDKYKYEYELIDVPNLFSKKYLLPINIFKYIYNITKSINFIKTNSIDIIISTGGYMTIPFCIAAFILKKKIFLFEPNSVLGRSNKFVLKFSQKIICYDKDLKNFPNKYNSKMVVIKPILKKQIFSIKKNSLNLNDKISKLLIIGGSQGASFFDTKITKLIIEISKKYNLEINQQISSRNIAHHLKNEYEKEKINYKFFEFTENADEIYDGVNLAITRGGAGILSELSYLKIPFISIPLPSARDNHQFFNSVFYRKKNCCWLIDQNKFVFDDIKTLLFDIFSNHKDYIEKSENLEKLTQKNTWNNTNNHIIEIINEN